MSNSGLLLVDGNNDDDDANISPIAEFKPTPLAFQLATHQAMEVLLFQLNTYLYRVVSK